MSYEFESDILVFGGRSREKVEGWPAWNAFEVAVLLRIRRGVVVSRLEYTGTDIEKDVGISRCFKAATIIGKTAYACTNTEVLEIDLDTLEIQGKWSNRLFNDLHHIAKVDDRFYAVSTGIDSILEFDSEFRLLNRISVGSDEVINRYGVESDFRRVPSTKPHERHPNFVARWERELWYTDFARRCVVGLRNGVSHKIAETPIHDGIPAFGRIWFTSVSGLIVTFDPETKETQTFDLSPMTGNAPLLGWCRGIAPVSSSRAIVGFTKLRGTVHSENVSWVNAKIARLKHAFRLPTRIAEYDLEAAEEIWRLQLAAEGMDAVFSVHVANIH